MNQSPFSFPLPVWALDEARQRLVLLLNHVLMQEKEATNRLVRQTGRVVAVKWRVLALTLVVTPAGLFDLAAANTSPDLTLTLTQDSPVAVVQALLGGQKPDVHVEGDVQLAAEVNWLVDHVRWDIEEDVSRIVGDVPARALGQAARAVVGALRQFVGTAANAKSNSATADTASVDVLNRKAP